MRMRTLLVALSLVSVVPCIAIDLTVGTGARSRDRGADQSLEAMHDRVDGMIRMLDAQLLEEQQAAGAHPRRRTVATRGPLL